jgi:hypothetical protein
MSSDFSNFYHFYKKYYSKQPNIVSIIKKLEKMKTIFLSTYIEIEKIASINTLDQIEILSKLIRNTENNSITNNEKIGNNIHGSINNKTTISKKNSINKLNKIYKSLQCTKESYDLFKIEIQTSLQKTILYFQRDIIYVISKYRLLFYENELSFSLYNNTMLLEEYKDTIINKMDNIIKKLTEKKNEEKIVLNQENEGKIVLNKEKKFKYIQQIITESKEILLKYIFKNSSEYVKNIFKSKKSFEEDSFIFNINVEDNEKIIIIGDIHGSFHTFFRILIRLHLFGVIDFNNYTINEGYRLIFLGDILDRGIYAFEIMYLLFHFFMNNNTSEKLKLIINRGNHEEKSMFNKNGFSNELNHKFNQDKSKIINILFQKFYFFCSSAIILHNKNKKYYLSHGGIPIYFTEENKYKSVQFDAYSYDANKNYISLNNLNESKNKTKHSLPNSTNTLNENGSKHSLPNSTNRLNYVFLIQKKETPKPTPIPIPNIIRWGDYSSQEYFYYEPNTYRPTIPISALTSFLEKEKIDFIIRGHNDDVFNACLLDKYANFISLNKITTKNTIPLNKISFKKNSSGKTINKKYNHLQNDVKNRIKIKKLASIGEETYNKSKLKKLIQTTGPIVTIDPNNWILKDNDYLPVLTISTNSDNGRLLNADSFIVFNFSDKEDFPNKSTSIQT